MSITAVGFDSQEETLLGYEIVNNNPVNVDWPSFKGRWAELAFARSFDGCSPQQRMTFNGSRGNYVAFVVDEYLNRNRA